MRKLFALAICACTLAAAACNTVEGVGQDVEKAGSAVAGAARDAKN